MMIEDENKQKQQQEQPEEEEKHKQQQQHQRRKRKRQLIDVQQQQRQFQWQKLQNQQQQQRRHLLQFSTKKNRLTILDDTDEKEEKEEYNTGSRQIQAECTMAGLLPFKSTFPIQSGYESSLAMELAIRHLNEGNDSLVKELKEITDHNCPIHFSLQFSDTQRSASASFSEVDILTRTVTDFEYLVPTQMENTNTTVWEVEDQIASTTLSAVSVSASASAVTEVAVLGNLVETSTKEARDTDTTNTTSSSIIQLEEEMIMEAVATLEEASNNMIQSRNRLPCAIVGAFDSGISRTTALVSGMREFPQISSASTSDSLNNRVEYPLFGRTMPSDRRATEVFIEYLYKQLNVRHIFVIFESHPYTRSIVRGLHDSIRSFGWAPRRDGDVDEDDAREKYVYMEERVISKGDRNGNGSAHAHGDKASSGVYEAIQALKRSKYRFVISLVRNRPLSDALMYTAHENQVTGVNDYYWWGFDATKGIVEGRTFPQDSVLQKAYNGYGAIVQTSDKETSRYTSFVEQAHELKRSLYQEIYDEQHNINNTSTTRTTTTTTTTNNYTNRWLFSASAPPTAELLNEDDWFQDGHNFTYESPSYSYDATILIGLSACREVAARRKSAVETKAAVGVDYDDNDKYHLYLTGTNFYDRIKQTNFTGISGNVLLDYDTGTRTGSSVLYAIENYRAFEDFDSNNDNNSTTGNVTFHSTVTNVYRPTTLGDRNDDFSDDDDDDNVEFKNENRWETVAPFIYGNGNSTLPEQADIPPLVLGKNGIESWVQGIAFTMFAIIIMVTIGFTTWTYIHRKERVVRASQPFFLYLLSFGILVLACAIVPQTYDHYGSEYAGIACNVNIWLVILGFGITFSALFAKTLRINIIMANSAKCRRIKLTVQDTLYPVVIIFLFNIVLLTIMMVYQPLEYKVRTDTPDEFGRDTQEYGRCIYKHSYAFFIPLVIVNIGLVCLAIFQTWKARNLSTEFAESKYIANALFVSLIATILTVPIAIVVQDQPNISTFISTTLVFILSGSVLCSIFIPKIMYFYEAKNRDSLITDGGSSGVYASSMSSISDRFSMGDGGEKILTTKSQTALTKEIKDLKRELAATKKRERLLKQENATLQTQLQHLSCSTDPAIEKEKCSSSLGDQNILGERITTNDNSVSEILITSKNKKGRNVSFSSQSIGSLESCTSVSFSDDVISVTRKDTHMVSFCDNQIVIPEGTSVELSSSVARSGPSGELSCKEPKVLVKMVEKLHPSSEKNMSDLSCGV